MDKVHKHLTDIRRKLSKIDKISSKGASSLNMKEMIKLSRKGSSVDSCMKKSIKDYEVRIPCLLTSPLTPLFLHPLTI
jgi:hypothetical protein